MSNAKPYDESDFPGLRENAALQGPDSVMARLIATVDLAAKNMAPWTYRVEATNALDKAGMGRNGKPNCLIDMILEVCETLDASTARAAALDGALRCVVADPNMALLDLGTREVLRHASRYLSPPAQREGGE